MRIFAIADLHLSFSSNKPMEIFGENWKNHYEKIKKSWLDRVSKDDLVLVPGDISWAMNLDEAYLDLKWISDLPGKKVLLRGNHDYWWKSKKRLDDKFSDINFLQNNSYVFNNVAIFGTKGCAISDNLSEHDEVLINREIIRLELSLNSLKDKKIDRKICIMHYPPILKGIKEYRFVEIFNKYGVDCVVYGHLHNKNNFEQAIVGRHNGIDYYLVSSDYLDFKVEEII